MRIKQTDGWCDPDVRSWTGYLDVTDDKSLFFYFFESRNKPKEDPVLMWINGGPGCSSSMGLFMELGPCAVADGEPKSVNDTKVNPWSWNKEANVFFLDEPVGVGFSTFRHGQMVDTAEKAGQDVAAFVEIVSLDKLGKANGSSSTRSRSSRAATSTWPASLMAVVTSPSLRLPSTTTTPSSSLRRRPPSTSSLS